MHTRNQGDSSVHVNALHEERLPLFDAYATDELDADEKIQVEHYLQNCQECQRLFEEITQLHHALGTLSETEQPSHSSTPESANPHSQSMVHTILARIEQEESEKEHATAEQVRPAQTSFHSPDKYNPALLARKRIRAIYLGIGIAACCVLLLGGLIMTLRNTSLPGNRTNSIAERIIWTTQQQSLLAQNSSGTFALKEIEITTNKEFHFYYAFKSSQQGTIHATALSSLTTGQKQQPVTLPTTVLPLGTIDGISVGVIRVQYLDRSGQTITLNITSPEDGAHWQITPLQQLAADPHPEGGGFYGINVNQQLFPEIIWSGPGSMPPGRSMISLFKNAAGTRYIFLEVDYAGKIVVISKEQCMQLIGGHVCH
jgi:hypothetical protein